MTASFETLEEIEKFLRDTSDPAPCPAQPPLCPPNSTSAEGSQQASSQNQGLPASSSTGMTLASCDVPGRVLTPTSSAPTAEDVDAIFDDLFEIFERNEQVTSSTTAGCHEPHAKDSSDCREAKAPGSKSSGFEEGSQLQDTRGEQTLPSVQTTAAGGTPVDARIDDQAVSEGQRTVPGAPQVLHWVPVAISTGDGGQSLLRSQMTMPSHDQSVSGGQMMALSDGQVLGGGCQQVVEAPPGLPYWTGSPFMWGHVPAQNANFQTVSSPFPKKPETRKAYVCPHPHCGKSYSRPSSLRIHQRAHSGQKPYACTVQGCAWTFSRSDELKRHMRRHTGERPYTCEACHKSFARADHVTQHQRVHTALRPGPAPGSLGGWPERQPAPPSAPDVAPAL